MSSGSGKTGRVPGENRPCPSCGGVVKPPVYNQATGEPNEFSYCQSCGQPLAWPKGVNE